MLTTGDALRVNAFKHPDAPCLIDGTRRLSYAQVNRRVNHLANGLAARGCAPGDAVAVYARNSIEYIELFHACAKLGVRIVTLNFWLRPNELETLFNHSDATWLVVSETTQQALAHLRPRLTRLRPDGLIVIGRPAVVGAIAFDDLRAADEAEPGTRVDPQAPCWMMYTSGTTGSPKGLVRSFLRTTLCLWAGMIEFGYRREDVFLAVAPFFHGVTFLPLMVMQAGGSVYVMPEFSPGEVLDVMRAEKISCGFLVPTMLQMVLNHRGGGDKRYALRVMVTGGAALPTSVKEAVVRLFGLVLYEFYGASESGFLTVLRPEDQLRKERCCGQPCFGTEIEIRNPSGSVVPRGEIGEIFSRCEGRFDGYYKDPGRTAEVLREGWFTAGDLGRMDEEGFVYIVDRKTDTIISGGENIYPREIEDVLRDHEDVCDCSVIGVPDSLWGEAVLAAVVLREAATVSADDLIAFCNARLAGFKRPKRVVFLPELPKNAAGKTLKAMLRQQFRPSSGE